MPHGIVSTIVKLLVASLVVGFVLTFFDITPESVLHTLGGTAQSIFETFLRFLRWSLQYVLVGAAVVVPIWLLMWAWRQFRGRRGR